MSSTLIYGLVDPRSGDVRYVGKTTNLRKRRAWQEGSYEARATNEWRGAIASRMREKHRRGWFVTADGEDRVAAALERGRATQARLRRNGTCSACGIGLDQRTPGCETCRSRHSRRSSRVVVHVPQEAGTDTDTQGGNTDG